MTPLQEMGPPRGCVLAASFACKTKLLVFYFVVPGLLRSYDPVP